MPRKKRKMTKILPIMPEKQFFKINEVATLCKVKSHTIRYWSDEFSKFIKPIDKAKWAMKYYRCKDVEILRKIRNLLYIDGFTIQGAIRQLTVR